MHLTDVNYWAVIVAAVAAFALGALWYTVLFGKAWQKELGYTDEYLQSGNMGLIFGSSFVMMLIMSFGMAMLMGSMSKEVITWQNGLVHGLLIGVLFSATSIAINYLYQRKTVKLWLIDASYQILFLGIIGLILGAWQ